MLDQLKKSKIAFYTVPTFSNSALHDPTSNLTALNFFGKPKISQTLENCSNILNTIVIMQQHK